MASLVGIIKENSENGHDTNTTGSAAPGPSTLVMPSASTTAQAAASVESKADTKAAPAPETDTPASKGIYKIDTGSSSFQKYLCSMQGAPGLANAIKNVSVQAKVSYYQNPAEYQNARQSGQTVLTGRENEHEQRIAMTEAYLNHALDNPTASHFVNTYFRHQKAGLENFKKTGKWNQEALNYDVDKLFNAIHDLDNFAAMPDVVNHVFDSNPATNTAMAKVKAWAPTWADAMEKVAAQMANETDPARMVPYHDFAAIKAETCRRMDLIGLTYKSKSARQGIKYMHGKWCTTECAPQTIFDEALKKVVPVYREKSPEPAPAQPAVPAVTPSGNSAPQPLIQPHPQHTRLQPSVPANEKGTRSAAIAEQQQYAQATPAPKPGLFSRAAAGIKSFFGFGKNREQPVPESSETRLAAAASKQNQQEFSKKDIPMQSWTDTLKDFWG
jgi:hypothetical protein